MTQHIEEARKLEPLGHISEYGFGKLKTRRNYCVSVSHQAEKEYTIGICLLSDAQAALAEAEERGRREERERCAIETGGVLVEMPPHPPNLMARVLAYLEGSDPKATSGGERNSDLRDWVRKVLEASK